MKTKTMKHAIAALTACAATFGALQVSAEGITVAYFQEWPMPFEYAKQQGTYDKALGVDVKWVAFESGVKMSAAMASGDVQLSVSQGLPPFVVATSAGQDLQILDVAVSYADNDNCVVRSALEIDKTNATELAGKTVAVPLGTAAHYGFLKQMSHYGVDVRSMKVVDMDPPDSAAAFAQGSIDMFCGWGGSLRRALEHGNVLMSGDEKTALGILVFDVTSGPTEWVAENGDLVAKFLKVTADANAMWADEANRAKMLPLIAKDAGMDEAATMSTMSTFSFPSIKDQLSPAWLGGNAQTFMKGVADVFVEAKSIDSALPSYDGVVNTDPLKAAGGM